MIMLWRTKLLIEDQLQFLNIFDESMLEMMKIEFKFSVAIVDKRIVLSITIFQLCRIVQQIKRPNLISKRPKHN